MRVVYPFLEERKKLIRLLRVQLVDVFGEGTNSEQALPSCDRVCAHDRMDRGQVGARVLRRTSRSFVYLDLFGIRRSSFCERFATESRCQAFEEFAVWLGEPGLEGLTRDPKLMLDLLVPLTDRTTRIPKPTAYRHQSLAVVLDARRYSRLASVRIECQSATAHCRNGAFGPGVRA